MIDNSGRTAVIFGVRNDSSLAWDIALKLHASGCRIALSYLDDTRDEVLALADRIGTAHDLCAKVDVRDEGEISSFLNAVYERTGPLNYILHGVAYASRKVLLIPDEEQKSPAYLDIPFDDLAESLNISAYSLIRICRVANSLLAGNASVLTLTYNGSRRVFPGYAGMGISKAALENMVLYLADHFRSSGVRVNALSTGLVMTASAGAVTGIRALRKITKESAPLGNISAGDVGNAALYYFSDLSSKVTGNIHFVDGGFNIMGAVGNER